MSSRTTTLHPARSSCRAPTQLTEGNNSGAARAAAAAAKAAAGKGGKGKGKGKAAGAAAGDASSTDASRKKAGRPGAPSESLAEIAFSCFEECVCIAAYSSPRLRAGASRTARVLAVSNTISPSPARCPLPP